MSISQIVDAMEKVLIRVSNDAFKQYSEDGRILRITLLSSWAYILGNHGFKEFHIAFKNLHENTHIELANDVMEQVYAELCVGSMDELKALIPTA